jgi:hypothetical protein
MIENDSQNPQKRVLTFLYAALLCVGAILFVSIKFKANPHINEILIVVTVASIAVLTVFANRVRKK